MLMNFVIFLFVIVLVYNEVELFGVNLDWIKDVLIIVFFLNYVWEFIVCDNNLMD